MPKYVVIGDQLIEIPVPYCNFYESCLNKDRFIPEEGKFVCRVCAKNGIGGVYTKGLQIRFKMPYYEKDFYKPMETF